MLAPVLYLALLATNQTTIQVIDMHGETVDKAEIVIVDEDLETIERGSTDTKGVFTCRKLDNTAGDQVDVFVKKKAQSGTPIVAATMIVRKKRQWEKSKIVRLPNLERTDYQRRQQLLAANGNNALPTYSQPTLTSSRDVIYLQQPLCAQSSQPMILLQVVPQQRSCCYCW